MIWGENPPIFGNIHVQISRSVEVQSLKKQSQVACECLRKISKKYHKTQVSSFDTSPGGKASVFFLRNKTGKRPIPITRPELYGEVTNVQYFVDENSVREPK